MQSELRDLVSVLVCTKSRPESLVVAVRSLLASDYHEIEVIVVDQSSEASEAVLSEAERDRRLRYVKSKAKDKSAALNEGLALARSQVIVCTDDDCEAPVDWVRKISQPLREDARLGAVFSNVVPGPFDRSRGYIPVCVRDASRVCRSPLSAARYPPYMLGMGAAMALRLDAVTGIGGFDESIGPGAVIPSGDDTDIQVRLFLSGWPILYTSDVAIVHHGFRTFDQGRNLVRRNWEGLGAVPGKLVRAGHPSILLFAVWLLLSHVARPCARDLLQLRRPTGVTRLRGFCAGFSKGVRSPVDRRTLMYVQV